MAIEAPESIGDVIAFTNIKSFGDACAMMPIQATNQQQAHLSRLNNIQEASMQMYNNKAMSTDPVEAASIKQVLTGHVGQDNALVAALAQILAKLGQTTPPVTVVGGAHPSS